jgi:DNA mismatch repair ATPase MutS
VRGLVADNGAAIELRQSRHLKNIVEQDHRSFKRRTRPMIGIRSFSLRTRVITDIETMHTTHKGSSASPADWPFRQPTASTAWPPHKFLAGTALSLPAAPAATEPLGRYSSNLRPT